MAELADVAYIHQQVFSTGAWWSFEEVEPGIYRRTYMDADGHYLDDQAPPPTEQAMVLAVFTEMLKTVTGDGGRKRAAGVKPPWWRDGSHMPAVWSHFRKRAQGELRDPDSGAHPYVHAAWRLLALAYQETHGQVDPATQQMARDAA